MLTPDVLYTVKNNDVIKQKYAGWKRTTQYYQSNRQPHLPGIQNSIAANSIRLLHSGSIPKLVSDFAVCLCWTFLGADRRCGSRFNFGSRVARGFKGVGLYIFVVLFKQLQSNGLSFHFLSDQFISFQSKR